MYETPNVIGFRHSFRIKTQCRLGFILSDLFIMRNFLWVISLFLLLCSCSSSLKEIKYLNDEARLAGVSTKNSEYRLRDDDNLYVKITGSNPLVSAAYNVNNNNVNSDAAINLLSYTIGKDGKIALPLLGEVEVKGKTVDEAKDIIVSKAREMYKKPAVIVKLVNKSVTLLGELNRPGKYTILKNRMSIFEALGLAGDLTDYGNRQEIKLLRNIDGKERMVTIDITGTDIVKSDYFWIFPNDVIYVSPRNRVYGSKTLPFTGVIGATVSVISTIISVIALTR